MQKPGSDGLRVGGRCPLPLLHVSFTCPSRTVTSIPASMSSGTNEKSAGVATGQGDSRIDMDIFRSHMVALKLQKEDGLLSEEQFRQKADQLVNALDSTMLTFEERKQRQQLKERPAAAAGGVAGKRGERKRQALRARTAPTNADLASPAASSCHAADERVWLNAKGGGGPRALKTRKRLRQERRSAPVAKALLLPRRAPVTRATTSRRVAASSWRS